ncbi:MAG: class I SAM-dependent methyltransferase [Verrucomicrobiota bacterium]
MSFDGIARWYRSLEWMAFRDELQHCRVACLGQIVTPRRALIVGEGDGRFLHQFLSKYPATEIDCLDASEQMLQLARERIRDLPGRERVRFLHRDTESWAPPQNYYDLLVTHFVLDCFSEVQSPEIVEKLARAATDNASWLLADFCVPSAGFARLRARLWLAVMYKFFRLIARIPATRLIDPTRYLRAERFGLSGQELFRRGMLKSELWRRHSAV